MRLITKVSARRVLLKNSQATGVEFIQGGNLVQASASQGVVLSAGALMSPKLLLCSGVGPTEVLSRVGIKSLVDLPGVGKNFQDHLGVPLVFRTDQATPGKKSRWLAAAWQYARNRDGPMVSTCGEAGCFISVDKASRNGIVEIIAMFQTSCNPELWN
ncbi:MAG: GMC family oxidoreductase N-terminal domain-containing protein [Pirellulaceae bacterium]|nr:GMC family oxidoreductase N-terminal domain-containing protein [Pirellulaceae bacterium]